MAADDLKQNLLGPPPIARVADRSRHFFPNEGKFSAVVVDRLVEEFVVGHHDEPARVLSTANPDRRVGGLHRGWLSHLHDRRLQKAQIDDVTAHPAHHDPITDAKRPTAKNQEVGSHCRDHFL